MRTHTNDSVIAFWETCDEAVGIGLLGSVDDFSISGLRLPEPDVIHHRGAK